MRWGRICPHVLPGETPGTRMWSWAGGLGRSVRDSKAAKFSPYTTAEKRVSQTETLSDPFPLFSSNVREPCQSQEGTIQKDERG